MAVWTLAEAQAHLAAWVAADLAVAGGQSATVGEISLTRVDAAKIRDQIAFWRREVEQLTSGRSGLRVQRIVPRDL